MPTILITGANRGIGLKFSEYYSHEGWSVIGACRNPEKADALTSLCGDVTALALDVSDGVSVAEFVKKIGERPIDRLVNNAGVFGPRHDFGETDYDAWLEVFNINTLGPMRLIEALADNVAKSELKQIFNISSNMGGMAATVTSEATIYRSSKAALNMVCRSSAAALGPKGVTVVNFHPGWVQTDMGGPKADYTPQESADLLVDTFSKMTPANNGGFLNLDGTLRAW
jgi:NAD(P)-dependent dehydrogenase (short-subunit alcohol dehydrogenase family)